MSPQSAALWQATLGEGSRHEPGVFDGDAESERAHLAGIKQDAVERPQQPHDPGVVTGQDALEIIRAVAAATPLERGEVDFVVDTEVLKRREVAVVDRLPQPKLNGRPMTEPASDVLTVHPLRRRSQAKQLRWLEVLEQRAVAGPRPRGGPRR